MSPRSTMPRLLLAAAALAVAVPASAQSRFVSACVASSAGEPSVTAEQARALCSCGAERALLPERGLTAARLDALVDYADPHDGYDLSLEEAPEAVQETAIVAVGSLMECLVTQGLESLAQEFVSAASEGGSPLVAAPKAAPVPRVVAAQSGPPHGIRTGNGAEPVQAVQRGAGAPIRIVR